MKPGPYVSFVLMLNSLLVFIKVIIMTMIMFSGLLCGMVSGYVMIAFLLG